MSKVAVVFWSGTGNTEAMAAAVASGVQENGGDVSLFTSAEFSPEKMDEFDAFAFGCPAMGSEVLEESEFEPLFSSCNIKDKKIALFGSYGWGDGEWMRNWEENCKNEGATLVCDSVICNDAPDDEAVESCKSLGKSLV